jgi:hypothetical protein
MGRALSLLRRRLTDSWCPIGIGRSPVRGIIQSYLCSFEYAWPISGARENKIEGHQLQQTAVSVADKHYVQAGDIH